MVSRVGLGMKAAVRARLSGFQIQSAAELGGCAGAQSFRATRRSDAMPVLLHKFRPAQSLLELEPAIESADPPDFTKPFISRFTDLLVVAGSAYLVEPLPVGVTLSDAWHYVLLNRPHQARAITAVLTRHLLPLVRQIAGHEHGPVHLGIDNIVLAPSGSFGVLAAGIRCRDGLLGLRKDPQEPLAGDHQALAAVLHSLLDMEDELADLRGRLMPLSARTREDILQLAHAVELSGRCARV